MNFQTVYLYDPTTGVYIWTYQAQESPLEPGELIMPTDSTMIEPPAAGTNQAAVFAAGAWSLQPSYIGQTIYNQTTGTARLVTALGPLPTGFGLTAPVIPPTPVQVLATAATDALNGGLAITSSSTPAINGTYPLDSVTQFEINSVTLFIQVNGDFPGGTNTYPWSDTSNTPHIFPSVAVFKEWATAIANYVAALKLYGAGASGATLPSASVTIA